MANWDRSTPWRQGAILTSEAAKALRLRSDRAPEHTAVVVVSHDCDLAQAPELEPTVEVIVGRFIDKPDGNYMHCKNVRCLHLPFTAGSRLCTIELEPRNRIPLPKATGQVIALADFTPSLESGMTYREHRTLQRWLAARYDRAAFPDEFDRRLKEETRVAEHLAKAFRETGKYIPAVYFDVDDGKELLRQGADDPYKLIVTLLYSTDEDIEVAEEAADQAARRVKEIFRSRCIAKDESGVEKWRWIELQDVEVMSDRALTYAQSLYLTRWQADHISLRADPQQPIGQF